MNVRVIVADERAANFFDMRNAVTAPQARGAVINEAAGLKDRDLETDRPGRKFSGMNGGSRHGVTGERSTHRHETELFAREVARAVDGARVRHEFDRLVLIAGPRMLGLLRDALPDACRSVVAAEVAKDFVHEAPTVIREAVPREVFFH